METNGGVEVDLAMVKLVRYQVRILPEKICLLMAFEGGGGDILTLIQEDVVIDVVHHSLRIKLS